MPATAGASLFREEHATRICWTTQQEIADIGAQVIKKHVEDVDIVFGPRPGQSLADFWMEQEPNVAVVSQDAPQIRGPQDLYESAMTTSAVRTILITEAINQRSSSWLAMAHQILCFDIVLGTSEGVSVRNLLRHVQEPADPRDVLALFGALGGGSPAPAAPAGNVRRGVADAAKSLVAQVGRIQFGGGARKEATAPIRAIPHLLVGIASPNPGAAFRTAGTLSEAWDGRKGDVRVIVADSLADPEPAGDMADEQVFRQNRGRIAWHSLGTAATQGGVVLLAGGDADGTGRRLETLLRQVYQRRTKGAALTLVVLGNPVFDPVARHGWASVDTVLWALESEEEVRVAAQWDALLRSLDMMPERVMAADFGFGSPEGVDVIWRTGDDWADAAEALAGGVA